MEEITEQDLNSLDTEELYEVLETLEGLDGLLDIVEEDIEDKRGVEDEQTK